MIGWISSIFSGEVLQINKFSVTVKFSSVHNSQTWNLTTVYGPCHGPKRDDFVQWLNNLQIEDDDNWMILGDFFYRALSDRNKDAGI